MEQTINLALKLAIVENEEVIATLPAGGKLEREMIASFTDSILSEIGWNRSRRKLKQAIHDGIFKVVDELKKETVRL